MKILSGVLEHTILVSVLLTIFTQNYFRIRFSTESELIDRIISNITINLAMFTVTNYMLSFIGVKPTHIYLGMIILIVLFVIINSIRVNPAVLLTVARSKIILFISILGPALFISIWQYIPTLTLFDSTASSLNMTSIFNNDIANYALAAKEYLNSGFTNSGRYPEVDFNSYSRDQQHLTVHLLISFTSFASNLPVWKIMNSVMIFTIALNVIILLKLFKTISNKNNSLFPIIAVSIALLNPLNSYVIHNHFLSQSLALFIFTFIIIKGHEIYKKSRLKLNDRIEITSIVILSVFSYPSILIPAFFGIFLINLISEKFLKKEGFALIAQKYRTVVIFGFLGFVLSIVYLPRALNILISHATIESGWELPAPSVIGTFFSPFYISNTVNDLNLKLSWLGLIIIAVVFICANIKSKKANKYYLFLISSIIIAYILQVVIRGQGFGYYQNWKLLSYILPVIITFVVAEILKFSNKTVLLLIPFLLAGLYAPMSLWKNGNEFGSLSAISNDLIDLNSIKENYGINSLNVMLSPYYQTMVVGLVTEIDKIYFSSRTYYPLNSNDDSCSLIENSDVRFSNRLKINETYSLISSENLNCDIIRIEDIPKLQVNTEYVFDENSIENRKILDRGWSYPESWGTWSLGENSKIRFNVGGIKGSKGRLIIKFNAFIPKENNEAKLKISLNGINIERVPPISNENVFKIDVKNLKEMNNILEFSYSNIRTPKDLGISEDSRLIFFGIASLMILEEDQ
jgi:hypothetical protein